MRLSVSYNYFNGDEHFLASLRSIRSHVDTISVVWQEVSNAGEPISQKARDVLQAAIRENLVNLTIPYEPDFAKTRKQNELQKRNLGLMAALDDSSTHFLTMDADEFYRPNEFREAKRLIAERGWQSTSVSTFLHIKRPIYRAPDSTNCCFITAITSETEIGTAQFPVGNIDSSRRLTANSATHHHFSTTVVSMYHMNLVRRDMRHKLRNSSTTDINFLNDVEKSINDWVVGEPFFFPRKGSLKVETVDNEFGTYDPEG